MVYNQTLFRSCVRWPGFALSCGVVYVHLRVHQFVDAVGDALGRFAELLH